MANSETIQILIKGIGDFSDVTGDISKIQQMLKQLKLPSALESNITGIFNDLAKETAKYQKHLDSGFKKKGDVTGLEASGERINNLFSRLVKEISKIDNKILEDSFQIDTSKIAEAENKIKSIKQEISKKATGDSGFGEFQGKVTDLVKSIKTLSGTKFAPAFKEAFDVGDIVAAEKALEKLRNLKPKKSLSEEDQQNLSNYITGLENQLNNLKKNAALDTLINQLKDAEKAGQNLSHTELTKFFDAFKDAKTGIIDYQEALRQLISGGVNTANAQHQMNSEVEQLKSKVQYFFGMTNAVNLMQRALRSAIGTIKDLDAAMTETAVVTDFTVGDMWDKLPQYTEEANRLGTSIKSLYEATTLYYQQGLNSDQAMGVGVETMKMARIANMDATAATTAMTAALRGFNMEINETSATRINDVYSELAAITAADTSQIATAMGKTASIADSANMEFETTAALLAQIIETTQEAPETAGTAMKTIIARFTEVKELFDEGMLSGKDEEGEIVDINKIDTALKTVGISLKDFLRGEKGIDDIFLELASKWDSLDLATQRYIATAAAGSRQQSRFIAMMSNYDRTMELVDAANNSAGASQEQFGKTLESLESKIQKLQNAWAEFTMGLSNNEVLKAGVDILTGFLDTINKITGTSGSKGFGGLVTTIARLAVVFGTLKGGKSFFNGIFKGLGGKGGAGELVSKVVPTLEGLKDVNSIGGILKVTLQGLQGGWEGLTESLAQGLTFWKNTGEEIAGVGNSVKLFGLGTKVAEKGVGAFLLGLGKISFIIGVAVAAIAGLVHILKEIEAASPQGKLKAAEEVAAEAGKAADEAASSYKNLKNALDSLNTKYSAMDSMVEGTQQWRDALEEVNGEVLALKEQYSELEVSVDSKGRLSISNQKSALDARMITANILSASKILSEQKVQEYELANEINQLSMQLQGQSQFKGNFGKGYMAGESTAPYISNINDVLLEKIAKDYYEDGASKDFDFSKYGELGEYDIEALGEAATGVTSDLYQLGESIVKAESVFTKQSELRDFLSAGLSLVDFGDSKVAKSAIVEALTLQQGEDLSSMDDRINAKLEQMNASGEYDTTAEINKKFAELYGHHYTGEKVYTDASLTTEVKADDSDKKRSIAIAEVLQDFQEGATNLAKNISKEDLFNAIFSEDGKFITEAMLKDYRTSDDGVDTGKLARDIGAMEFEDAIRTNIDNALKNIAKRKGDIKEKLSSTDWEKLESKLSTNFLPLLENFYDVFDRLAQQEDISDTLPQNLFNEYDSMLSGLEGEAALKAAQDIDTLISNINWSNPIQAAHTLTKEIENGSAASASFARTVQNSLSGSLLSAENQWSYFLNSEGFADVNEDLTKILQTNDEISASDITELKNEYAEFNDLLENTEMNASAAAKMLEALKEKRLGIDELTDSFLKAASALGSLEGLTVDVLDKIANFDAGLNESEVNDFVKQSSDLVQENIKAGKFGNTQMLNTLDFFFGEDWDKGIDKSGSEYIRKINELGNILLANSDNFKQSWMKLYHGTDIFGKGQILDTELGQSIFAEGGLKVNLGYDGSIKLSGYEGFGTDQIASAIADALSVPYEYAQMMVVDYSNRSPDFAAEMDYNDLVTALAMAQQEGKSAEYAQKLIEMSGIGNDQLKNLNADIEAVASTLPKDIAAEQEEQKEQYPELERFAQTILDEQGEIDAKKTWEALAQEMGHEGNYLELIGQQGLTKDGVLQYDKAKAFLDAKNYSEKTSQAMLQMLVDTFGKVAKDGKNLLVEEGQTIEQAEAVQAQAEQYAQLADAIAMAFAEVPEIKLAFDESDFETFKAKLEAFCAETYQIKVDVKPTSEKEKQGNAGACCDCGGNEKTDGSGGKDAEIAPTPDLSQVENGIESVLSNRTLTIDASGSIATIGAAIDALVEPRTLVIWVDLTEEAFNYVHARGIKNSPTDHMALVSEEGPELIQTEDGFYLTGQNGPEIAHINRGDTVYTAEETRQILKPRSHKISSRYEDGLDNRSTSSYLPTGGGGGGGSGEDSDEDWENDFDKLYNLIRQIEEENRQRERIERRYEQLLEDIATSANGLVKASREQLQQLQYESQLQRDLIAGRKEQIEELQQEEGMAKYAWTEINAYGEQILRINWELIEAIKDSEKGDEVSDYISKLEEWVDSVNEAENTLRDIEDEVKDIKQRGEDEYFDLEEKIKDAVVKAREEEIEKLNTINDTINDSTSNILNSLQKTLDRQRQTRENQETEEELSDLRRQLAYLQQDTSGANDSKILELQKQIKEGTTDYTDQLIDQKISELQDQNEKASEQRQWQIELAQAQLDQYVESGQVWNEVYKLMEDGLDENSGLVRGSRLEELLSSAEGFEGMSQIGKMKWLEELTDLIAQSLGYLELGRQLEDLYSAEGVPGAGQSIVFYKDGKYYQGTIDEKGNVTTADGKKFNNVYQGYDGRFYAGENYAENEIRLNSNGDIVEPEKKPKKKQDNSINYGGGYNPTPPPINPTIKEDPDAQAKRVQASIDLMNAQNKMEEAQTKLDKTSSNTWQNMVAQEELNKASAELKKASLAYKEAHSYKTGGLADFTGPAWLDGTKSKPEYVLNSVQTKSFLTLVDVLSDLKEGTFKTNTQISKGDTFDIDINIESIREEVDIDMVAEKVQKSVVAASKYRNNIFTKR